MSQQKAPFKEACQYLKEVFQPLALASGYVCMGLGYFLFSVALIDLLCNDFGLYLFFTGWFHTAGYWIIPGWLLLRLAAGLFPFSKKFYKPAERPLFSGTTIPLP